MKSISNIIDTLDNEGFDFFVFARGNDKRDASYYEDIIKNKWLLIDSHNVFYYSSLYYLWKELIHLDIERAYFNSFFSPYSTIFPILTLSFTKSIKLIIAPRGELTKGAISQHSIKKHIYLYLFRILASTILRNKLTLQFSSEKEKELSSHTLRSSQNKVIYNLPSRIRCLPVSPTNNDNRINVITVARVVPIKNLHKSIYLLSKISDIEIEYEIIGNIEDKKYYDRCLGIVPLDNSNLKVIWSGHRDKDYIYSRLSSADLFMLLSKSENFGHAIVEAMQCGCPVVIGSNTPWSDAQAEGVGLVIDNDQNIDTYIGPLKDFILNFKNDEQVSKNSISFIDNALKLTETTNQYKELFSE